MSLTGWTAQTLHDYDCIMPRDAQLRELGDLTDIGAGYPFRSAFTAAADGPVAVVQLRDLRADEPVDWQTLQRTHLAGRKPPDVLCDGDIIFASRGTRFAAAAVQAPPLPAVCSQHFFVLRPRRGVPVLPAYLAWVLNSAPAQRTFAQAAEGSSQLSVRKPVLAQLRVPLVPLERQHAIVRFVQAAQEEQRTLERLIANRRREVDLLADALADQASG